MRKRKNCYDCPDRWVDLETGERCHTTCEIYLKFRQGKDIAMKKRREQLLADMTEYDSINRFSRSYR